MKNLFTKTLLLGGLAGSLVLGGCGEKEKEIVQETKPKSTCLYTYTNLMNNCKTLCTSYLGKEEGKYIDVCLGKESTYSKNVGIYYEGVNASCLKKITELSFIKSFSKSPNSFFIGGKDVFVKFTDFNNDNKLDILAAGVTREKRDSVEFYVLTNLGNESFSKPQKVGAVYLPAYGEIVVVTEDYNKDGLEDIGCRTFSNDSPSYSAIYDLINRKNNSFESKITHKGYLK